MKKKRGDFDRFERDLEPIVKRNAEAISGCETFIVIHNRDIAKEVLPVLQMGIAVYLDKPVLLLVRESERSSITNNLLRLATAVEYYDDAVENVSMEMQAATMRLMEKAGMVRQEP